ncbi:MAG: glycosyltransferase [Tissierellia bacterium]|nr:glycosyltransferase [Tissierellia bacterium]
MPDRNAAAQRVVGNAKGFRDLGYETFFIGLSKKKELCNVEYEYDGFKFINLKYPESTIDWIFYLTSIKPYNNYLNNRPNIVIAYNFPSIALNRLRKWASKESICLLADCTEWYESKGNILFNIIKGFDTTYRMKYIHPKLDGIIAISNYLYEYYREKTENVIMVPPLVDLSMDKWNCNQLDFTINDSEKVRIIYAGSPGSGNKDRLDLVLSVLSQLKDEGIDNFSFSVIGMTESQYNTAFRTLVPSNISNNVLFKGRLSHKITLNEIKKAHFNLFLRDNNLTNNAGFPTKFVESISCGTPALTNSTSNISDFIVEGKNGFLITDNSIQNIKATLSRAIKLPHEDIYEMKKWCYNSRIFDYKNYISKFSLLIQKRYDLTDAQI